MKHNTVPWSPDIDVETLILLLGMLICLAVVLTLFSAIGDFLRDLMKQWRRWRGCEVHEPLPASRAYTEIPSLIRENAIIRVFPACPASERDRALATIEQWRDVALPDKYRDFLASCDGLALSEFAMLYGSEPHEFDTSELTITTLTLEEANNWDLPDSAAIVIGHWGEEFVVYDGSLERFGVADRHKVEVNKTWESFEAVLDDLFRLKMPTLEALPPLRTN